MNIKKTKWLILLVLPLTSASLSGQVMYPGDANNNGVANAVDVLYIGQAYGTNGPPRFPQATINWMPQSITNSIWSQSFPSGVNYAYADCNGDGIINEDDIEAVRMNFLEEHGGNITPDTFTANGSQGVDPGFRAVGDKEFLFGLDTLNVDILLGSGSVPVNEFYGIAFTAYFDPALIEGEEAKFFLADEPWYDPAGLESVSMVIENPAEGRIDVAITRTNQAGANGSGTLGRFSFVIIEDVVGEFVKFEDFFEIKDIKLIDNEWSDMQVFDTLVAMPTSVREVWTPKWRIFPNPARESITLETGGLDVQRLRIINMQGQEVRSYTPSFRQEKHTIPLYQLPSGAYFVEMYTPQGRWAKKMIIP